MARFQRDTPPVLPPERLPPCRDVQPDERLPGARHAGDKDNGLPALLRARSMISSTPTEVRRRFLRRRRGARWLRLSACA